MKKLRSMADLMNNAAPTTAEPTKATKAAKSTQQQLVVHVPAETLKALKVAALEADTTVRAMLLDALEKAGYPVPAGQSVDLRRTRSQ